MYYYLLLLLFIFITVVILILAGFDGGQRSGGWARFLPGHVSSGQSPQQLLGPRGILLLISAGGQEGSDGGGGGREVLELCLHHMFRQIRKKAQVRE